MIMKMYKKQNLHTHSTFCDGRDTPEEMIDTALERGFDSLGFSMHSYVKYSSVERVNPEKIAAYCKEIAGLKEKYKGIIDIFLGLEYDFYSDYTHDGYDYLIGSVHYLDTPDGPKSFDTGLAAVLEYIKKYYPDSTLRFARDYYRKLAELPKRGKIDIIGHFDLITKNNEIGKFLDTDSADYKRYALEAVHALKGKIEVFEVNTGAIARGYRTLPYPSSDILRELKKCGFYPTISSDCHNRDFIDCHFDSARELLRSAGFSSQVVLTATGFCEVGI